MKNIIPKNKPVMISICAVLVLSITLLIIFASGFFDKGQKQPALGSNTSDNVKMEIMPISSDSAGVDLKSGFKLLCSKSWDEKTIKSSLSVFPEHEYTLKRVIHGEYMLSFNSGLKPNSIYRFAFNDEKSDKTYSWAFQTKKTFQVVRTLPSDKATSVPLNTGIELTFSYSGVENIESFLEIFPKVEGRFEYRNKTVVFVPKELKPETIYRVMVKKGLGFKGSELKTEQDYKFEFQTENNNINPNYWHFTLLDTFYSFTTQDCPALEVYADESLRDKDIAVDVYKYPGVAEFESGVKKYDEYPDWAYSDKSRIDFDISGLEKVSSFTTRIYNSSNEYWRSSFVCFPEQMHEGYYITRLVCNDTAYNVHMQINDMMSYIMVGNGKTLAWVMDSAAGKPVNGASIEADGIVPVATDKDGIAEILRSIPLPKENSSYYFKISVPSKLPLVVPVKAQDSYYDSEEYGFLSSEYSRLTDKYWTYMYLDRGVYLPTDSINIWGVVKPRSGDALPSDAVLQLVSRGYAGYQEYTAQVDSTRVQISPLGTFKGKLEYSNLSPGSYNIELKSGSDIIISRYFEVRKYVKPAYTLGVNPDKPAMFGWDKVKFGVQAGFFDGTPVSGLNLDYYYFIGPDMKEGKVTCDENGHTGIELYPEYKTDSWHPVSLNMSLRNSLAEEQEVISGCSVELFPKDTMIEVNGTKKGSSGIIEVKTNKIDLSCITGNSVYHDGKDYPYRGEPVDLSQIGRAHV